MNIKHLLVGLTLLVATVSSCLETPTMNNEWQIANEAAFNGWKDSIDIVKYEVPANRGGGMLLYRKTKSVNSGISPIFTDSVVVHYRGMYYDRTVFDGTYRDSVPNEYEIDKPVGFRVNSLIRGWSEGLQQMKQGEKCLFIIPSELGYGTSGDKIPAYTTLLFEVELIKVIKK